MLIFEINIEEIFGIYFFLHRKQDLQRCHANIYSLHNKICNIQHVFLKE